MGERKGAMSPNSVLKKLKGIQVAKPSEQVAKQFKELLDNNELRPGDVLPGEHELAKSFGIGRSHVREAIKLFQLYGIFKPVQGVGTVVTDSGVDSINEYVTKMVRFGQRDFKELVDARALIEPFNAYHAAQNATDDELRAIGAILAELDGKVGKDVFDVELECSFHLEIARAAHNRILENAIRAILPGLMALLNDMDMARGERYRNSNREHHLLFDALARRDPAAAEDAMRRHMVNGGAHFTIHISRIAGPEPARPDGATPARAARKTRRPAGKTR